MDSVTARDSVTILRIKVCISAVLVNMEVSSFSSCRCDMLHTRSMMFLCGLLPLLRHIFKLLIGASRRKKKRPSEKECSKKNNFVSLQKEKMRLLEKNQRLKKENNLLRTEHLQSLSDIRKEIGR